jgi:hypothetical protein
MIHQYKRKKTERQGSNEQVIASFKRGLPIKDTFEIVDKVIAEQSTTTPSSSGHRLSQINQEPSLNSNQYGGNRNANAAVLNSGAKYKSVERSIGHSQIRMHQIKTKRANGISL